jgi:hypothetical protein
VFVGWGAIPVFSEYTRSGELLFNGHLTPGKGNYRAVRARWVGRPAKPPAVAGQRAGGGRVTVFASWNGHTGVDRWQVLAGRSEDALHAIGRAKRRTGFETRLSVRTRAPFVAVRAFDARGKALGRSDAERSRR